MNRAQNKPNQGDLKRISTLDAEIESATAELDQLNEKSGKIEQAIKVLEKRILEIGGSRLLGQKSKVDGIRLLINIANEEITRAEVARAKAEKDVGKLTASIESNGATYEEYQGEVKELEDTLGDLRTYLTSLREKYEDAQQAAENSKEDLDELKKKLDERDDHIQEFLKKQVRTRYKLFFFDHLLIHLLQKELEQKILDIQKELKENGDKIEHWQSEHDKLELEEIE